MRHPVKDTYVIARLENEGDQIANRRCNIRWTVGQCTIGTNKDLVLCLLYYTQSSVQCIRSVLDAKSMT